jgi:hypothetical protein
MKIILGLFFALSLCGQAEGIQVAQLVEKSQGYHLYSQALPTLLRTLNKKTTLKFDTQPVLINQFTEEIFNYPIVYVNYGDRRDWNLSEDEVKNLRTYLNEGGFLYIDAGINASFLDEKSNQGQHHSFANWQISSTLEKVFQKVMPESSFAPLPRSHQIFKIFNSGLPNPRNLPKSVQDFVVDEKWPDGTFSLVALKVGGHIAVLASPIVAMGWGKNSRGQWASPISFRVREESDGLSGLLAQTKYQGRKYGAINEAGLVDEIYCVKGENPSWVKESSGKWRVFRYYQGKEISDFAHRFYTRLGMNIFIYALTQ